jgi:hypothetical protein
MNRLKEIRELGNDILLLHHTTKLSVFVIWGKGTE